MRGYKYSINVGHKSLIDIPLYHIQEPYPFSVVICTSNYFLIIPLSQKNEYNKYNHVYLSCTHQKLLTRFIDILTLQFALLYTAGD